MVVKKLQKKWSKLKKRLAYLLFILPRKCKYQFLSDCAHVIGKPAVKQPLLLTGTGCIEFGESVNVGYEQSPEFFSSYTYVDARADAKISFGARVWLNNSCSFIAAKSGIEVGSDCLFGPACKVFDSDFHELDPHARHKEGPSAKVTIGSNVFLGSNVTILKGVQIGDNTVIASGSVVVNSIPGNVVAGGVPAKVINTL